ncbi:hypothetical protein RintRC_2242 [Richelia intracellularis]|nr:hypothetical protein RintRC_2242 [Richelia intracellularis]
MGGGVGVEKDYFVRIVGILGITASLRVYNGKSQNQYTRIWYGN